MNAIYLILTATFTMQMADRLNKNINRYELIRGGMILLAIIEYLASTIVFALSVIEL